MTLPEVLLWQALRSGGVADVKFRRQHPIGRYVLDFYNLKHRLAVEVDGWCHAMGSPDRDERRDAWLVQEGVRVLRIPATEVLKDLPAVLDLIAGELDLRSSPPRSGGEWDRRNGGGGVPRAARDGGGS